MPQLKYSPLWSVVILDESGSMSGNRAQVIKGFNTYLKDRREDAEKQPVKLWLTKFSSSMRFTYSGIDAAEAPLLSNKTYCPNGMTALLDAIGYTIHEIDKELKGWKSKKNPPKILFLIFTDGQENSSTDFDAETIQRMIQNRESSELWSFKMVGANIDPIREAALLGLQSRGLATTNATFDSAMDGASKYVRGVGKQDASIRVACAVSKLDASISTIRSADDLAGAEVDDEGNIRIRSV